MNKNVAMIKHMNAAPVLKVHFSNTYSDDDVFIVKMFKSLSDLDGSEEKRSKWWSWSFLFSLSFN